MKRKNKKGQAAMEFLMTYGWAILIAIIAIAALIAFGVLNVGRTAANVCTLGPPLEAKGCYLDYINSTTTKLQVAVHNGGDGAVTIERVSLIGKIGKEQVSCTKEINPDVTIQEGEEKPVVVTFTTTGTSPDCTGGDHIGEGKRFKDGTITLYIKDRGASTGTFTHTII
ncbi:MAG: hypothetical protein NZ889_02020 [Candidatus Pacearchaeota archaeon]|nr:hypothetical protein [Candidatus Pacearchaeota archaeon]